MNNEKTTRKNGRVLTAAITAVMKIPSERTPVPSGSAVSQEGTITVRDTRIQTVSSQRVPESHTPDSTGGNTKFSSSASFDSE